MLLIVWAPRMRMGYFGGEISGVDRDERVMGEAAAGGA
jgi:hypothetical protein